MSVSPTHCQRHGWAGVWCIISALLDSGGSRGSFSVCGPPGCHPLSEDRGPGLAHHWGPGAKPDQAAPQGGWDSQWVTRPGLASSPLALGQVCQEGPRTRTSMSPVCGQTGRSEGTQGLSHSMATSCTPTVGRFVGSLGAEQPPPLCGNPVPRATRVLDFMCHWPSFPDRAQHRPLVRCRLACGRHLPGTGASPRCSGWLCCPWFCYL